LLQTKIRFDEMQHANLTIDNIRAGKLGSDFFSPSHSPFLPDATSTPRVDTSALSPSPQDTPHPTPKLQTVIVICPTQAIGLHGGLVCSCRLDDDYSQAEVFDPTSQAQNKYPPYSPIYHVVQTTPPQLPHAHSSLEVNLLNSELTAQEKHQARLNLARRVENASDQEDDVDKAMLDDEADQEMSGSDQSGDGEQMDVEQEDAPPAPTPGGILSMYLGIFTTPVKKLIFGSSSQKTPTVPKAPATPSRVNKADKSKRRRSGAQTEPRLRSRPADFEKLEDFNKSIAAIPILEYVPGKTTTPSSRRAAALRVPPSPHRNTNAQNIARSRLSGLKKRRASDSVGATFSVPGYASAAKKPRIDNNHRFGPVPNIAASTIGHDPIPGQAGYHSATELPPPNFQGHLPESIRSGAAGGADDSTTETQPFGSVNTAETTLGDNTGTNDANSGTGNTNAAPSKGFGLFYDEDYFQDSTELDDGTGINETVTEIDQDIEEPNRAARNEDEEKRWEGKPFNEWTVATGKAYMDAPLPQWDVIPPNYEGIDKDAVFRSKHDQLLPPLLLLGISPFDYLVVPRKRSGELVTLSVPAYFAESFVPVGQEYRSPAGLAHWKKEQQYKSHQKYQEALRFWKASAEMQSKHDAEVQKLKDELQRERDEIRREQERNRNSLKRERETFEQEEQQQLARHKEHLKLMEKQFDERRRTLEQQLGMPTATSNSTVPNPFGSSSISSGNASQTPPAWTQAPPPPPSPAHASLPQTSNFSNQPSTSSVEAAGQAAFAALAAKNMEREKRKANRYAPKDPSNLRVESHFSSPMSMPAEAPTTSDNSRAIHAPAFNAITAPPSTATNVSASGAAAISDMTASDFGSDDSRTVFNYRQPTPPSIVFSSRLESVAGPTSHIQAEVDAALSLHGVGRIPIPKLTGAFSIPRPSLRPEAGEDEVR
jgi:hypothetical protein